MFAVSIVFVTCVTVSNSAKILCAFPIPSVSHLAFHQTISKELSLKGHQVTVLTSRPLNDNTLTNLTEIKIENQIEIITRNYQRIAKLSKDAYDLSVWTFFNNFYGQLIEEMITQIKLEADYDLLIVEALHPLVYSLGCRFKTSIVAVSSSILSRFALDALGNSHHPLVYHERLINVDVDIGMYEKVRRIVTNVVSKIFYHWVILPKMDAISKKHFGETCPYIEDIHKNVSLLIANTNPVLNTVRPNVPAFIEVGGFLHVQPKKPIPQDIQDFLDQSAQGVVYFSLGSSVTASAVPETFKNIIVEAFAELPYNVLWKWEVDLPNKPRNVMIKKWFPQQDILGHKNLKVFVTQGGLQSTEEAIANCVPLVGIPFFLDQPFNVVQLIRLGVAQGLDYSTITKDGLKKAIVEVAENYEYKKKVQELKDLIQDRSTKSLEKAIWWIEYVLRHNGARHLRGPAVDISWSQYFFLDVLVIFVVPICIYYFRYLFLALK